MLDMFSFSDSRGPETTSFRRLCKVNGIASRAENCIRTRERRCPVTRLGLYTLFPMWRTPDGDRTLQGNERRLVSAAGVDMVAEMVQAAEQDDEWIIGIPVVDRMDADDRPVFYCWWPSRSLMRLRRRISLRGTRG